MAEFSGPFDGSPIATQSQWSGMAKRWGLDGVHALSESSNLLKVTASGTTTVAVAPGRASVNGFYYHNSSTKNLPVPPNTGGTARTDLVILRADPITAKQVTAVYKAGGASAPSLTQDDEGIYEVPLAQCTVAAGSSVVTAVSVLDRRWLTDRGALPSVPGARRPSIRNQLLVEGGKLFVGDGAGWRWLGSSGVEDSAYTPVWTAGTTTINWGSGSQNIGRYQAVGNRVDVTIQLIPSGNPPGYPDPIMVSLPPGLPATGQLRSLFQWNFTSNNGEGSATGVGYVATTESVTRISRLRYPATTSGGGPDAYNLLTNTPFNIRTDDVLTIDGSYWLA
ncbi:hypothetical protein [Streptomyces sp. SID8352]|uniref:hypothetical protein n=1 Tax=Streptomyces sp. SID8352 TaxID=2690338 RepID=UPI001368B440|nr:hypothetical protein [Streptomyces sp. SID8352]MYU24640.1 hypothetical protein [Streptomyces sp. SID8352]